MPPMISIFKGGKGVDPRLKELEQMIEMKRLELEKDQKELEERKTEEKEARQDLERRLRQLEEKKIQNKVQKDLHSSLDEILERKKTETEAVIHDWVQTTRKLFQIRAKFAEDVRSLMAQMEINNALRIPVVSTTKQRGENLALEFRQLKAEADRLEKALKELKDRQALVQRLKKEKETLSNPENDPAIKMAYMLIEKQQEQLTVSVQDENLHSIDNFDTTGDSLITEPRMYAGTRPRLMYSTSKPERTTRW